MDIKNFVNEFYNHPILFIGSGMSLRYLNNSYNWNDLLEKISFDISNNSEDFIDFKSEVYDEELKTYNMPELATLIGAEFDKIAKQEKDYVFRDVNKTYYSTMKKGIHTSRLKIYISNLLEKMEYNDDKKDELLELRKIRKNIGSVITTNYDEFIEDIFKFSPLIGNDILLSNPYGSVYKIHGCISKSESIVINTADYKEFEIKYELIRAQLLSLFIHNPIIFLGYSISDENIRKILETIFSYVNYDDDLSEKIRRNFLLVEREKGSNNRNVVEHDITIGETSIRINKIKTDNYKAIYKAIADLRLSISAMDVKKVQSIVGDIYKGGKPEDAVKVRILEDLDDLNNSDKVLVIGSEKTIKYEFRTVSEMMVDYFSIIDENNIQLLDLIDKQIIQSTQYFPIFAFNRINNNIKKTKKLKDNQIKKMKTLIKRIPDVSKIKKNSINAIEDNNDLSVANKINSIIWNTFEKNIRIEELKEYLVNYNDNVCSSSEDSRKTTNYRKLLCVYDFCEYSDIHYSGDKIHE